MAATVRYVAPTIDLEENFNDFPSASEVGSDTQTSQIGDLPNLEDLDLGYDTDSTDWSMNISGYVLHYLIAETEANAKQELSVGDFECTSCSLRAWKALPDEEGHQLQCSE